MFMTKWEKLADQNPRLAQFIKEGLRFAYIHYKKMDRTKAYIICMCKSLVASYSKNENN
jgi:hypothetical protein